MADAAAPALPFTIGARVSERQSFTLPSIILAASASVIPAGAPVQIPAVGYLKKIRCEFTLVVSGGTPTLSADAPFNVINNFAFKNAAGANLIAPLTGYEWYVVNKYGGMGAGLTSGIGRLSDPKVGYGYTAVAGTGAHFFLDVPLEIDASDALGSLPALASNRSFNFEIGIAAISTVFGGTPPTVATLTVDASAIYWDVPVATTPGGVSQQTEPFGLGTLSQWQKENPVIAPGEQLTRLNNVGNSIRSLILIAKTSAGVRTDTDWPSIAELYFDNAPMLRLKKTEHQDAMSRWFGLTTAGLDSAGGLDTGVFTIPFHLLAGGESGDPSNSRAQYLPTLDASLLQLKGYNWGSNISQLVVLTDAVSSPNAQFIYSK